MCVLSEGRLYWDDFRQQAVRSVCPDPRALPGVSLIPVFLRSSLFFPRCYVSCFCFCISFWSLKVMLVKRDIILFTLPDVRLQWNQSISMLSTNIRYGIQSQKAPLWGVGKCFQCSCCINCTTFVNSSQNELMFPAELDHYKLWLFQVVLFFREKQLPSLLDRTGRETKIMSQAPCCQ